MGRHYDRRMSTRWSRSYLYHIICDSWPSKILSTRKQVRFSNDFPKILKIFYGFRNETKKEIWKWNGRVVEKFSKNIISKREPDDSFEMSTFYQGASAVVLAGTIIVLETRTRIINFRFGVETFSQSLRAILRHPSYQTTH